MADLFAADVQKAALISDDGLYRYLLLRAWNDNPPLVWLMLNPSTADAAKDDPTITRCIGFARRWDYGGIKVVNLFAYRATNCRELQNTADPVGPENDRHLIDECAGNHVIAAWGASNKFAGIARRAAKVLDLIRDNALMIDCLAVLKDGHPKHPLMVRGDATLIPFHGEVR